MKSNPLYRTLIRPDGLFSLPFVRWIGRQPNSVFLETTKSDRDNFRSYVFLDPSKTIESLGLDTVEDGLREVDRAIRSGHYVAGLMSYEAGFAFERITREQTVLNVPFVWFGVYENPWIFNHRTRAFESGGKQMKRLAEMLEGARANPIPHHISTPASFLEEGDYVKCGKRIMRYIRDGDTYQVNFTFKLGFEYSGGTADIYCRFRQAQHVPYSGLIALHDKTILSFSPELFFRLRGRQITLKPMKGTAPRGRWREEDDRQKIGLQRSEKDRAENLMIVDLLRNDVGKIAETGTVRLKKFFQVEQYETVYQATSTIQASLRPEIDFLTLTKSLFPSGSVTGAPKIRTMQIIQELERQQRGVYTGSIGFVSPRKKAVFNVAIRTVVLDRAAGTGELGIGSGITTESDIEKEHQECLLKARFLAESQEDFRLIETLRWEKKSGWSLFERHMRRLRESAEYFGFTFKRKMVLNKLRRCESIFKKDKIRSRAMRVRLLMDRSGAVDVEHSPLEDLIGSQRAALSVHRTRSGDRFLFHKTTNRALYDNELERARQLGLFDVVFLNERGEVTEGARSNLIIQKGNRYYTPPLECGVLPGTGRAHWMRLLEVREKILHRDDLNSADQVYLCNALRGLVKVELVQF